MIMMMALDLAGAGSDPRAVASLPLKTRPPEDWKLERSNREVRTWRTKNCPGKKGAMGASFKHGVLSIDSRGLCQFVSLGSRGHFTITQSLDTTRRKCWQHAATHPDEAQVLATVQPPIQSEQKRSRFETHRMCKGAKPTMEKWPQPRNGLKPRNDLGPRNGFNWQMASNQGPRPSRRQREIS